MKIIGVDVGTSGLKVALYNEKLELVKSDYASYTVHSPSSGMVVIDPEVIWAAFKKTLRTLLKNYDVEECALSFSFLGDALIVTDGRFRPIIPSILSSDTRSSKYSKKIKEQLNPRWLYEKTGRIAHPMAVLNRLLWLSDQQEKHFKNAQWFLDYPAWFFAKLGFKPVTDYSSASGTLFFNIKEKKYDRKILNWAGVPEEKLPGLIPSGELLGYLNDATKEKLGLSVKIRIYVVSGGMDQICNALGTGTVRANQMVCSMGTVEATTTILPHDINREKLFANNYYCSVSAIQEQYVTFSFLWSGSGALRWFKDNLGDAIIEKAQRENKDIYDVLIGKKRNYSKELFLPYLSGTGPPFWNSMARGVFLGLNLSSTQQDLVDALLEGICFDLRYNLEQLSKSNINVEKIGVVGGGSRSEKWLQIKADIIKRPVCRLKRQEGGCLGAALLAGYGVNLFEGLIQKAQEVNAVDRIFYPSKTNRWFYEKKYAIFQEAYQKLTDIYQNINCLSF